MAEMLHHILSAPSSSEDHIALRAEDDTSSGDNMAFLSSKLTWETGEDGRERVIDADGNG
jgi:protein arginine N-methyltransferase 2